MSVVFHPPPRRILVRGVNWLGDAVMTTPALLRLRAKFPDAQIALLTPDKLTELWRHHPAVNETIAFTSETGLFAVAKTLKAGKFDLALVFPNSPRSALEVFLAHIPQRVGYARPLRNFFLTRPIPPRQNIVAMRKRSESEIKTLVSQPPATSRPNPLSSHHIHDYLHLVAALGANPEPLAPQLFVTLEEVTVAAKQFGLDQTASPIFGLNPGAEYGPAKRWPAENFIAAAKEIHKRTGCTWLLFGGKSDSPLTASIASALHASDIACHDLAGRTSLRELMALLKLCRVLLTNDTGPMHVAAALGTPVVVPFGSTSPELTGPGLPGDPRHHLLKSTAPCSPCFLRECPIDFRCMKSLTPEHIVQAVLATQNK
jgi:heptosyltransferase-2